MHTHILNNHTHAKSSKLQLVLTVCNKAFAMTFNFHELCTLYCTIFLL